MEALSSYPRPFILKVDKYFDTSGHSRSDHLQFARRVTSNAEDLALTHQLFDDLPRTDTLPWNNLIRTHIFDGELHQAMDLYQQMLIRGVHPDKHTVPRILSASRLASSFSFGKQVHGHAVKLGLSSDDYVITALMQMYGQLGGADCAKKLFEKSKERKNAASWTLLIAIYLREHEPRLAVDMFYQMVNLKAEIDAVAIMTAVGACGMLPSLKDGRKVHGIAMDCGLQDEVLVGNSLLKMYLDCGSIEDARIVFDRMPYKDAISWTEMTRGYVKKGGFNEGLKLFRKMILEGVKADQLAISSVLPACARMTAHKQGKELHGYLIRNKIGMNLTLQNALMDMYAKSGYIESASKIFSEMSDKDAISWTIMIHGYSLHGQGARGVQLFQEMEKDNAALIDPVTYASVLRACRSANWVKEGMFYFNMISVPEIRHYSLMVSLLARAGLFKEARAFIERKRIGRHPEVLRAMLDGCKIQHDIKTGKHIIEELCELDPLNAEYYILLSNCYASNAKWDMVDITRQLIRDMGLRPKKAYSWIEFRNKVHVFGTGDVSHPRSEKIHWELHCLAKRLEDEGYHLDADYSLHDVDEERECSPTVHSEMLAISFGLISTKKATICVTKNLSICHNCHNMSKIISRVLGREIVIKDPDCFHHFKDGECSCQGWGRL